MTRRDRSRVLTVHGTRYTITERKSANYVGPSSPFFRPDLIGLPFPSSSVPRITLTGLFSRSRAGAPCRTHNCNNWRFSKPLAQRQVC